MLDFDEMLIQVGEFGLYQKILFVYQAPFCIFVTFLSFSILFMTLYPTTIWCEDHFQCTFGNMTPMQRASISIPYTSGSLNPCFLNNVDASFIKTISDFSKGGSCGTPACNYTQRIPSRNNRPPPPQELSYGASQSGNSNPYEYYTEKPTTTRRTGNGGYGGGYGGYGGGDRYGNNGERGYSTEESTRDNNVIFHPTATDRTGSRLPPEGEFIGRPGSESSSGGAWNGRPSTERPTTSNTPVASELIGHRRDVNTMNQNCPRMLDIQMDPRARVLMLEMVNQTHHNAPYRRIESCKNIVWNRVQAGVPYRTVVTDGDWWCNANLYETAATVVFFLGAIVGGILIGWIADSYGRVPALVIANLFGAVGGALTVVSTNIWIFLCFRFLTGIAFDNSFTMMYILVLEFCGPTYRTLVANLSIAIFYTLGTLILPWLAVGVANWQIFGLAVSLPMLLGLLAIFFVPESARWLLSKGRTKEATNILRSFAKVNGKKVDDQIFVDFENDAKKLFDEMQAEEEDASFIAALKTPRLRMTFILLTLIWSMIALVYDGHSRNILNLANEEWNVFWMFTIAASTEFPADILLIFTLDRLGRRWLSFGTLTLSGVSSIIAATIPQDMRTVGLIMAIISRFFVNMAFNIGLQYASELLPTVIRAQGVNAIHIMGYVASIVSPFLASLGRRNPAMSLILLGIFAIIGGCLSLFLSETLGEELPNTLEEAELFGKDQSFLNCPICAKPKVEEPTPPQEPESLVRRRNNLRSSIRGEAYRSSIISSSSKGSRRYVALNPVPTETTRLRPTTH